MTDSEVALTLVLMDTYIRSLNEVFIIVRSSYTDRPAPSVFLSVTVSTSGHVYDDFVRLLFLYVHCEGSILAGELPEESEQCRFLRAARLVHLKDSVGLILDKPPQ